MPLTREWYGDEIKMKLDRAAGRAAVGIGVAASRETKLITHRITGTLARSVHSAPAGYEGYDADQAQAPNQDLMMAHANDPATMVPGAALVEVGSWLPYACVEWVGRGHPGVTQGLEATRGYADRIVAQAVREEGL